MISVPPKSRPKKFCVSFGAMEERRLQRETDRHEEREHKAQVDCDAADARGRLDVHAALVGGVEHADSEAPVGAPWA